MLINIPQEALMNGPIKPNVNAKNTLKSKSSNALSVKSEESTTPWTDENWENLLSDNQQMQNAMQYKWNEHARNTSLTSYVNQLKENGINPILAASNFGGSTGSTPSFSNSTKETEMSNSTNLLSTAISIMAMALLKGK